MVCLDIHIGKKRIIYAAQNSLNSIDYYSLYPYVFSVPSGNYFLYILLT